MYEKIVTLLAALGYQAFSDGDKITLYFINDKVSQDVKNNINWDTIPPELEHVVLYRMLGEFLQYKKAFSPDDLSMLDLSGAAVKQIQAGDTSFTFGNAETAENRLSSFIQSLNKYGAGQLSEFRRIRW